MGFLCLMIEGEGKRGREGSLWQETIFSLCVCMHVQVYANVKVHFPQTAINSSSRFFASAQPAF